VALAESFELTADSLELIAPADVVERIVAVGDARSVSRARDSLNVESLPDIARADWLEGDTVVISLKQVADTTLGAAGDTEYEVDRIVARVGARSLYRLPPEDSTAAPGIDPPAVHYVVGDEITLVMEAGEVQSMEVVGQTRGVHLEPLRAPPDSLAAEPDSAAAANDFSMADFDGRVPPPAGGSPPSRGQPPWNRP
jgi:hypothetical protein